MPRPSNEPKFIDVAVAVVVENMSDNAVERPVSRGVDALRALNRSSLRVLVTLRSAQRVLAGHWELPGGKIEPGEAPEQAVVRELQEEVGIVVKPLMQLDAVEHVYDHASVRLLPYVCRRVSGVAHAIEVDEVRWVALDALAGLRFPEASLPVIASLHKVFGPA